MPPAGRSRPGTADRNSSVRNCSSGTQRGFHLRVGNSRDTSLPAANRDVVAPHTRAFLHFLLVSPRLHPALATARRLDKHGRRGGSGHEAARRIAPAQGRRTFSSGCEYVHTAERGGCPPACACVVTKAGPQKYAAWCPMVSPCPRTQVRLPSERYAGRHVSDGGQQVFCSRVCVMLKSREQQLRVWAETRLRSSFVQSTSSCCPRERDCYDTPRLMLYVTAAW